MKKANRSPCETEAMLIAVLATRNRIKEESAQNEQHFTVDLAKPPCIFSPNPRAAAKPVANIRDVGKSVRIRRGRAAVRDKSPRSLRPLPKPIGGKAIEGKSRARRPARGLCIQRNVR
jgi:hypothetical protein